MSESFFHSYLADYRPFKSYWNYEDGCVLTGCRRLYEATGDDNYAHFIMTYLSQRVAEDGFLPSYLREQYCLDSVNCSKALFFADAAEPQSKYGRALQWQYAQLKLHPRTKSGLFWHKQMYPQQVWLDGLYMLLPFLAEYALWSPDDAPALYEEIGNAFSFVYDKLRIPRTGLYRHGIDEAGVQAWADENTGVSASHWLRGEGWLLMALVDVIALLPDRRNALTKALIAMLQEAVTALMPYLGQEGMFYQVIDCPDATGNYTEASGNAMIAYTMLRGASLGILSEEYGIIGDAVLAAVCRYKLTGEGNVLRLHDICACAGLGGATCRDGSSAYYCTEPRVTNDPKGVGALMMACAASLQWRARTHNADRLQDAVMCEGKR